MLLTKKQKKVLNLSLIIALIAVIVATMAIGIYFIIKFGKSETLSREQIDFAKLVNSAEAKPIEEKKDVSLLPSGTKLSQVVYMDGSYAVIEQDNGEVRVYSIKTESYVQIGVQFESVEAVVNDIAILVHDGQRQAVDLASGQPCADLAGAAYQIVGKYILVKSIDYLPLEVGFGQSEQALCYIVDTLGKTCVLAVGAEQNCLDVSIVGNFAVAVYATRTDIISLGSAFQIVKTFENKVGESGKAVQSALSGRSFNMESLTTAKDMGQGLLLVETATRALENPDIITTDQSTEMGFAVSYIIYDAQNEFVYALDKKGSVLRPLVTNIKDYYALIYSKISSSKTVDGQDEQIRYFYLSGGTVKDIVSYDYQKYGQVVGSQDGKLILAGGTASNQIDFNGQATNLFDTSNGQKVSQNGGKVVTISSPIGLKQLYKPDGTLLTDGLFQEVSPFIGGCAVAFDGQDYYRLDASGKTLIDNFATGLKDYVFMGIGYYFTQNSLGIDIYSLDGTKVFSRAQVEVRRLSGRKVMLSVVTDQEQQLIEITAQREYLPVHTSYDTDIEIYRQPLAFSGAVRGLLEAESQIEPVSTNVDEATGVGTATYEIDVATADLEFLPVSSLSAEQRAMLPAFDQENAYVSQSGVVKNVVGAHFITGKNVAIAIIQIGSANSYEYLITFAAKDAYLSSASGTFASASGSHGLEWFEGEKKTLPVDFTSQVLPFAALSGTAGLYGDDGANSQRKTNAKAAGYDGAFVVAAGQATSLTLSVTLRNVFYAADVESTFVQVDNLEEAENHFDFELFDIDILVSSQGKTLVLTAKNGYLLSGFTFEFGDSATSVYQDIETTHQQQVDAVSRAYTLELDADARFVKVSGVTVIELFHMIDLADEDGSTAERVIYYYGYADEVSSSRNLAPLGFDNFFRREKVNKLTKTGYTFDGYELDAQGEKTKLIDASGSWIGAGIAFGGSGDGVKNITLTATYQPNEYKIYYMSQGALLDEIKTVVFDSAVGELFDIVHSPYNVEGHDFMGWFTKEDEPYDAQTIYRVADDLGLTLYAKWEPKKYEITLDANALTYQGKDVLGFSMDIGDIFYLEDYGTHRAGERFEGQTISVTFGEAYGQLPSLVGYSTLEGRENERYTFIGWYTESQFTVGDHGVVPSGTRVDESTVTVADPISTLYAHFKRDVFAISIDSLGEDVVADQGVLIERLTDLVYTGADQNGQKVSGKSVEPAEISGGVRYAAYAVQGEGLLATFSISNGYYAVITINIYDSTGVKWTYTLTGTFDAAANTLSYQSIENDKVLASVVDGQASVNLLSLVDARLQGDALLAAEVLIDTRPMTYETNITIEKPEGQDDYAASVIGEGIEASGNVYSNKGSIYGVDNNYTILPSSTFAYGANMVSDALLERFTVGGTTINFTYSYAGANSAGLYFYDFTTDVEPSFVEYGEVGNEYKTATFTITEGGSIVSLTVTYYEVNKAYEYALSVVNKSNVEIAALFNKMQANVSLTLTNIGEQTDVSGVDVTAMRYRGQSGSAISTGSVQTSLSDAIVYTITPRDSFVLRSLIINIAGVDYLIARPVATASGEGRIDVAPNFVALGDLFKVNAGQTAVSMEGTFVSVEWLAGSRALRVVVLGVMGDVSVKADVIKLRTIQVTAENADDFAMLVESGAAQLTGKPLSVDGQSMISSGNVFESHLAGQNLFTFIILGMENSIVSLRLNTKVSEERSVIIDSAASTNSPSGALVVAENLTSAVADLTNNTMIYIRLMVAQSTISVESYLGRGTRGGQEVFEKEPLEGFGYLSNIEVVYHTASGQQTSAFGEVSTFDFVGNKVVIRVHSISGYTLTKVVARQGENTIEPVATHSAGVDEYAITITDFRTLDFSIEIYQSAIKYMVVFNNYFNGIQLADQPVTELMYYNVWNALCGDIYTLSGYTLVGWSAEEKSGADLTRDDIDYELLQTLSHNLSSEEMDEVMLYPVFVANDYLISYNLNDLASGNGSSPASLQGEEHKSVKFDHELGTLAQPSRQGYAFAGWFTSPTAGELVEASSVLDKALFDQLELDGQGITLYAHWTNRVYSVQVHANDSTEGNGSTPATGGDQSFEATYDQAFEAIGGLNRIGYDFLGYKALKLTSDQAKVNVDRFIANGADARLIIDYSIGDEGVTIDDESLVIDIYAVWQAQLFDAFVNLNNQTLATYGQADGFFTVQVPGKPAMESNTAFVNLSFAVEFDKAFGTMPTLTTVGYNLENFYSARGNALEIPSSGAILQETVLDYALFNNLTFSDSSDTVTPLASLYTDSNMQRFSIYAYYTIRQYTFTYEGADYDYTNTFHAEALDDYLAYAPNSVKSGDDLSRKSLVFDYAKDFVLDIMTKAGTYISVLNINYSDQFGVAQTLSISFEFDNTGFVIMTMQGSSAAGVTTTSQHIEVLGQTAYVAHGIYVKIMPYNKAGSGTYDPENAVVDASRIVVSFDNLMTDVSVLALAFEQVFELEYYAFFDGHQGINNVELPSNPYLFTREITYGQMVGEQNLAHVYFKQFGFVNYYYGAVNEGEVQDPRTAGSVVTAADVVKENKTIVGVYTLVTKQGLNFFYYNVKAGEYQLREDISQDYVLTYYDHDAGDWVDGALSQELFNTSGNRAGTVTKLPSPSSELWPNQTCFVGYVIASSAPEGGQYFSFSAGNTAGLKVFDLSVMVEGEYNVYAVYNQQHFSLEGRTEAGGGLSVKPNATLYDVHEDGTVRQLEPSEVLYITLSQEMLDYYLSILRDVPEVNKETALRMAIMQYGGTFDSASHFSSGDFESVSVASGEYVFGFTVLYNSRGEMYIYCVASNYLGADGQSYPSVAN